MNVDEEKQFLVECENGILHNAEKANRACVGQSSNIGRSIIKLNVTGEWRRKDSIIMYARIRLWRTGSFPIYVYLCAFVSDGLLLVHIEWTKSIGTRVHSESARASPSLCVIRRITSASERDVVYRNKRWLMKQRANGENSQISQRLHRKYGHIV